MNNVEHKTNLTSPWWNRFVLIIMRNVDDYGGNNVDDGDQNHVAAEIDACVQCTVVNKVS